MSNYIVSAEPNILNGLLSGSITFNPGLNIISGENGTLKTKLLQHIKSTRGKFHNPEKSCKIQAISPKRNAERKTFEAIFQQFRQQNVKLDSLINERNINDQTFDNYPSLGDLFYVVYDDLCKDGANQIEKMELTTIEFNQVIQKIFSHYELRSEWNSSTGSPKIKLIKNGFNEVPLESLSLGEQEMLSLVVSLNASRNRYDVFLIDEPEVHLNWHLEEKLFEYLDDFCELQEKQMIIVTHSRAIFQSRFLKKTQFLYWNSEGKISWGKTLTKEQSRRIAGEAIDIIKLGEFSKTTFFVEDYGQRYVIEALARVIEIDVSITECGNSSNVKSLFNYSKSEGGWANTFFLVDGDNQGNSLSSEKQFIQLDKYCIENYLLDFEIAAKITDKDETAIKQIILTCIKINASKILKKNKFFEFLVESLAEEHITPDRLELLDASEIMPAYLEKIGMAREDYINKYVIQCQSEGKLNLVFSPQLIEILNNTKVTSTDALKDHR